MPDYIESGTYVIAGALCGKDLIVKNLIPTHIEALTSKLKEMGSELEIGKDYIKISACKEYKPVNITTAVYPGFPTDLQQTFGVLLTQCEGKSKIMETIFENRFMHIPYLKEMGANIEINETLEIVEGKTPLVGKDVVATDLRAGAAMILAALIADGTTRISSIEHVLRGYENIDKKLRSLGADIKIMNSNE